MVKTRFVVVMWFLAGLMWTVFGLLNLFRADGPRLILKASKWSSPKWGCPSSRVLCEKWGLYLHLR